MILTASVRNALKATTYLGLGDMWRAVRIHHSLKVRPPPHGNTLSNLEVTSMLHPFFFNYGKIFKLPIKLLKA